jgi:hypothetical protein
MNLIIAELNMIFEDRIPDANRSATHECSSRNNSPFLQLDFTGVSSRLSGDKFLQITDCIRGRTLDADWWSVG